MQSPVYLLDWFAAACAAWLIWSLGIKSLLLDLFRERLFEIRFGLFSLGLNGELDFNDPAYRSIETLFCGLLQFAHRISFLTYIVSVRERYRAMKDKDYVDVSKLIALRVSRLDPTLQSELNKLAYEARKALTLYMVFNSLPLFTLITTMGIAQRLGLIHLENGGREQVSLPIEREAFCYESRIRRPKFAMAN